MKIQRLFAMIYILLDKKRISARELAERFEISVRTVYRDVEILSQSGIPIYMSRGKNGGIALLPNFILNKALLSEEEMKNTLSAIESLHALGGASMAATLEKLAVFFGKERESIYEIDFQDWGQLLGQQLKSARQAILEKKQLSFRYVSSFSHQSQRIVEPYKLCFKDKTWYLKAFCLKQHAFRLFRLSRMRETKMEQSGFSPRPLEGSFPQTDSASYKQTELVLHIDAAMSHRVLDEFLEKDVQQNEDGSFIIRSAFIEDEWLYGYLLSFGNWARVQEPAHIRCVLKQRLQEMLKNYL